MSQKQTKKTEDLKDLFVSVTGETTVTEEQEEDMGRGASDGTNDGLPTTSVACPTDECDGETAKWYMQQIRSADESETRFFICVTCNHKWREDDH